MKILIVDDDPSIREIIRVYLTSESYDIIEAENGEEALELVDDDVILIILDIMMPKIDGLEVCHKIRTKYEMPILFLTAKTTELDKVSGLMSGADDYITKPFNPMELLARVKSHLRRYMTYASFNTQVSDRNRTIQLLDLIIDLDAHIVKKKGMEIPLTKTEFGILELLITNRGRVFSLVQIYEHVWNEQSILNSESTVSVHIKRLRKKIETNVKAPEYIKTVWGVGYRVD